MTKIIIVNIQQTPIPKIDHTIIFLILPGFDVAKRIEEINKVRVDNGPSITKSNTLIKP